MLLIGNRGIELFVHPRASVSHWTQGSSLRGAERPPEEGPAGTNQSSWQNAARRKTSRMRLQTRHRKGEFVSFLAGNPDCPPQATITLSSILILFAAFFHGFCVHSRLPGYIARMPRPRPFYLKSIDAPPEFKLVATVVALSSDRFMDTGTTPDWRSIADEYTPVNEARPLSLNPKLFNAGITARKVFDKIFK